MKTITEEEIDNFKAQLPDLYKHTFEMTGSKDNSDLAVLAELIGFDISQYMIRENKASIMSQSDMQRCAMIGIMIGAEWKERENGEKLWQMVTMINNKLKQTHDTHIPRHFVLANCIGDILVRDLLS